jgi:hypothetical protein
MAAHELSLNRGIAPVLYIATGARGRTKSGRPS